MNGPTKSRNNLSQLLWCYQNNVANALVEANPQSSAETINKDSEKLVAHAFYQAASEVTLERQSITKFGQHVSSLLCVAAICSHFLSSGASFGSVSLSVLAFLSVLQNYFMSRDDSRMQKIVQDQYDFRRGNVRPYALGCSDIYRRAEINIEFRLSDIRYKLKASQSALS